MSEPDRSRPTIVRYKVAALAFLLAMITYLDRVCVGTLAPRIMEDFSLNKVEMGWVFSSFAFAYAIFEIPTARYADRIGTRAILTRIVAWWSVFTLATGAAFNYASLLVVRFLFGAGEAGAWPCAARTLSRWIPVQRRGVVQGLFFACAYLAGASTPKLVTWLLEFMHWRWIFVLFGAVGLVWVVVWHAWFRSEPSEHRGVNAAELKLITEGCAPPETHAGTRAFWKATLLNRNVAALCVMYFPNSFAFYFCITWLPTYLGERHHLDEDARAFYAGLPLYLSMAAVLTGGGAMDALTGRLGLRWGRCGLGAVAYLVAAAAMLATPLVSQGRVAATLLSCSVAACMFTVPAAWGLCMDIGRNNAGVVSATMNTASQIGSLLCPLIVAYSLKWFASWDVSIFLMGGMFLVGAISWTLIDPRRTVVAPAHASAA